MTCTVSKTDYAAMIAAKNAGLEYALVVFPAVPGNYLYTILAIGTQVVLYGALTHIKGAKIAHWYELKEAQ